MHLKGAKRSSAYNNTILFKDEKYPSQFQFDNSRREFLVLKQNIKIIMATRLIF